MTHPRSPVAALTYPQQLVVWGLRRRRLGAPAWSVVAAEFHFACGRCPRRAAVAVGALQTLALAIETEGRRPPRWAPLDAPCLGADETLLLALLAAYQAGETGLVTRYLEWLFPVGAAVHAREAASALADALADAGCAFPRLRTADAPPRPPRRSGLPATAFAGW